MSTSLNAGNAAGTVHGPNPGDLDSTAGREATPVESGSQGISGASPSNTAPHNSKTVKTKDFHLLRVVMDSLYLSFPGRLHGHVFDAIKVLKTLAQSDQPEEKAQT